ncbi:MAG: CPBP family intramembrane metalloprotease [Bacteroidetes bacterium]|nr:CPBP family intramembrane metalloprotease [Bacteroidota bacterium]
MNSITSGIFEELVFRGVILALLLRHYFNLASLIFGTIHLLNLFNTDISTI